MTIYEQALNRIYAAFDRMNAAGSDDAKECMMGLLATIIGQRLITGDPNEKKPVGVLGRSPIATALDCVEKHKSGPTWH